MRRTVALAALAVIVVLAAVMAAGLTDAYGTGALVRTDIGGAMPDRSAHESFWDAPLIDVPGLTVTAVHCHGAVKYELQVGATTPSRDNACYAAMGSYSGQSSQWGVYEMLPGNRAVYRISENYGSWRYCIAGLLTPQSPRANIAPSRPPC